MTLFMKRLIILLNVPVFYTFFIYYLDIAANMYGSIDGAWFLVGFIVLNVILLPKHHRHPVMSIWLMVTAGFGGIPFWFKRTPAS